MGLTEAKRGKGRFGKMTGKMTGQAVVCGVIGDPVGHSLSPLMHNYIAEAMGLDYIYVPCHVDGKNVRDALNGAYALGFVGLNVTVPHKQAVIPYLAELDESVKSIGACNTLVRMTRGREDGKTVPLKGYNTDAEGLFRAMTGHGMEICGRDCLLIGAGGAARAAAYLLVREKAASVYILNRSVEKAKELAEGMRTLAAGRGYEMPVEALPLDGWRGISGDGYLAIQTTSAGMYPDVNRAPVEDEAFYRKIRQAIDVVYTPRRTRFMEYVEAAGGTAAGGLDMLVWQGVAALELWKPGLEVPAGIVADVRQVMEERLGV